MENSLVSDIAKILEEKNHNLAAKELEKVTNLDCFGTENFLHDIILERWVYRPEDIPFPFARDIWKMSDTDVKSDRELLKNILEYPIANINKAKNNDFLWVVDRDFVAAKQAEELYRIHIESTQEFDYNFMAINRLVSISKNIHSRNIDESIRSRLLLRVLDQYNNGDHGKILHLIRTAANENVDEDYLLQYTEKILNLYDDKSYDYHIIGEFCDILEQLYCKKFRWTKKKCISEPKLIEIRKRKVRAIMMAEKILDTAEAGSLIRSITFLKKAINILKTIEGTETERKELLKQIDEMEKKMVSNIPVFSSRQDNREVVRQLLKQLEVLDKEEIICYFALFIPIPERKRVEQSVTSSVNDFLGFGTLFPIGILGKDGKSIAKSRPIKKCNDEVDLGAFQDALEHRTSELMDFFSQIMVWNTLNYIRSKFVIEEKDIREIVENSVIVPMDRKEAYIKGLMAGFFGDFLTALYILIPQVENSIRELAIQCGEPVYNLNENGIEELKTMHAVLELEGVKECLDDDFLLAIKTIFCSKFGFNMRNDIAHGLVADKQFNSYKVLYTWWFILKMCYMFCGKLQIDNRIKVNKKLEKLLRESEEQ